MDKYGYSGESKFKPLSPWAYFGYAVLFSIPVVGLIVLIVLCFNDSNINRRSYARSYFCALLIIGILLIVAGVTAGSRSGGMSQLMNNPQRLDGYR